MAYQELPFAKFIADIGADTWRLKTRPACCTGCAGYAGGLVARRNAQIARQGSDVLGTALAAAGNGDFTLGQLGAAESRLMMRLVEPAEVSNKRSDPFLGGDGRTYQGRARRHRCIFPA